MIADLFRQHQRIAIDTNFCVYALDGYAHYIELCRVVLEAAFNQKILLVVSGISEMELLVKPIRDNNKLALRQTQLFLHEMPGVVVQDISRTVLGMAAGIRARENLKAIDAIVAASALIAGCTIILGNDVQMKKQLRAIPYICLDDFLS
ncbi:MAG: PIN domain-containing protein [Caldilineaceae bacterium]